MSFLLTPLGRLVALDGGPSPVLDGNAVRHGEVVEKFESAEAAARYYNHLKRTFKANGMVSYDLTGPVVTSVSPGTFNIRTSTVIVRGYGFAQDSAGTLWIEDPPSTGGSGQDSNGYHMACTVLDDNTMTAVFASAGDGTLPAGECWVYYVNGSLNQKSNWLDGTVDASQNVTLNAAAAAAVLSLATYEATPGGSDGTAVNASVNGCVVKIQGTGFTRSQRGVLITPDGTVQAPARYVSAGELSATLPPLPAGTLAFAFQYTNAASQRVTLASAISITFS